VTVEVKQCYALDGTPPPATIVLSHGKVTLHGKVTSFGRFSLTSNIRPGICVPAADRFISRDHASFRLDALGKCTFVFVGANALAKHNGSWLVQGAEVVLKDLDEIKLARDEARYCYVYYAKAGSLLQKRNGAAAASPLRGYSLPFHRRWVMRQY
jgi:hypothetical protein